MVIDLRVNFSNNNEADDCFTLTQRVLREAYIFFRPCVVVMVLYTYINLKIRWHFTVCLENDLKYNIMYMFWNGEKKNIYRNCTCIQTIYSYSNLICVRVLYIRISII